MIVWFRKFLINLDEIRDGPTVIHEHNSANVILEMGKGKVITSKNIGLIYYYLREKVDSYNINFEYIPREIHQADVVMKPLAPSASKY